MTWFVDIEFCSFLKGQYSKITFRTPLYVGGTPSIYWLVRATGTNRGFQGCVQSLSVNGKRIDMRPWPLGRALNGADVGKQLPRGLGLGCSCGIVFPAWAIEVSNLGCNPGKLSEIEPQVGSTGSESMLTLNLRTVWHCTSLDVSRCHLRPLHEV